MNSFVTLAVAMCKEDSGLLGTSSPPIVAFAMLHARRDHPASWSFSLATGATSKLDDEVAVMTTLADTLPRPDVLIGRALQKAVYMPLLRAADNTPEPLKFYIKGRLARAFSAVIVDFNDNADSVSRSIGKREPELLRVGLRTEVIDDWHEFLARAGGSNAQAAKAVTNAWLTGES